MLSPHAPQILHILPYDNKKMGIVLTVVSISKYFGTLYAAENITTIVKMYFFHLNGNKDCTYTEIY